MCIGLTRIDIRGIGFPAIDDLDAVVKRTWRYKSWCESLSFRILSDAGVPGNRRPQIVHQLLSGQMCHFAQFDVLPTYTVRPV
jgi:hypothetical protein